MHKVASAAAVLLAMVWVGEARADFVDLTRYQVGVVDQIGTETPTFATSFVGSLNSVYDFTGSPPGPRIPQSRYFYAKFDLGAVPAGSVIISATLSVRYNVEDFRLGMATIPEYAFQFSAGGSRAAAATLADFLDSRNPTVGILALRDSVFSMPNPFPPATADLTAVVRANFGSSPSLVLGFPAISTVFPFLNLIKNVSFNLDPSLRIEYATPAAVPEPSSLVLCGVALAGGLGVWARGRKHLRDAVRRARGEKKDHDESP